MRFARVLAQIGEPCTAQGPRWLMLDEPVSSLDVAHQSQVMSIAKEFARAGGGVLAVMHDLNLIGLFADRVVVMAQGQVLAAVPPVDVMTDEVLSQVYGCALRLNATPPGSVPLVLPHMAKTHATP